MEIFGPEFAKYNRGKERAFCGLGRPGFELHPPGRQSKIAHPRRLTMKLTRISMLLGASACALFLVSAQAQGIASTYSATPMPVVQEPQNPPSPDQSQDQSKVTTFTGTIVKDGEQYILRDSSGSVYKLDDASRAQSFEGKTVKVTGRLDPNSKIIHVDSIQVLAS
jgi:uncharacterized protein YdeI (BOF family)